ncbi:MAG: hypothetical protein ACJ8CR_06745 [Roseiflexaceae bacterium]
MKDKRPRRNQLDRWWSLRLTYKELADTGFEERERGSEAGARHLAYIQNAYATLSPTHEIVWCGAWAGVQVGAAVLAIETALLIAIIGAALSVDRGQHTFATLYGQTPLARTFFEPLWPVVLSLPALPFFGGVGALAALMRRAGNRWRRALDRYFSPLSPMLDLATFWILVSALLIWGSYAAGLLGTQADPTGLLTLALCAGGIIAWPSHRLWLLWYLPLIRARGSASIDEIRARIRRQL